jgi:coenzyme F420 biosynthesis associated uncharacterized protein
VAAAASPIDWARAEQVAVAIANRKRPAVTSTIIATITGTSDAWEPPIEQIEQQIEDITGLRSAAGHAHAELIDRATWIRANIASFSRMLAPVFERWSQKQSSTSATSVLTGVSRQVAGAELGALLGWMSTRVLGQYDLLVGGDRGEDAVYLVEPNLAAIEQRFGFDPHEFRTWVLVHELTHRAQFTGVPWMRGYFTGLVDESLRFADPDPKVLLESIRENLRNRSEARQQVRDSGVVGLIAGPEQRAVIASVGGLMSLLEGHGDVTMTRAAGDLVPSADRFGRVLAERRKRGNPMTRLILRLTGMEAKLNQYAAGERFIAAIEAEGGTRVVDTCWEQATNLPSLEEIRTPALWLHRMGLQVG